MVDGEYHLLNFKDLIVVVFLLFGSFSFFSLFRRMPIFCILVWTKPDRYT